MGRRIPGKATSSALTGGASGHSTPRRRNLQGLEGAIASLVVAEADPSLVDPSAEPTAKARAWEARRAARKRVRAELPREQADRVIARARATSLDLRGIAGAPEQVRARLIAGAVDAIATMHAEGIVSPLDRLRLALGRRLVSLSEALIDRAQVKLDANDLRSAAYIADRGLALIRSAREDAAERPKPTASAEVEARFRAMVAAREERERQAVAIDVESTEPEPGGAAAPVSSAPLRVPAEAPAPDTGPEAERGPEPSQGAPWAPINVAVEGG